MKRPVVRSIDVGYGNTKFVVAQDAGGTVRCDLFPSLAPPAPSRELGGHALHARDTVRVPVEGSLFEVGREAWLALDRHHSRVLHEDFVDTPEYLALLRGALAYMADPVIDLLIVGLPVQLMASKKDALIHRLVGLHQVSPRDEVTVKNVRVFAQPLGGFVDHAHQVGNYEQLRRQVNLLIDPGFFTFDWLTGEGLKERPAQSGSFPTGVSKLLRGIAQQLSKAHNIDYQDLHAIDRGLRTDSFRLYGKPVALGPLREQALNDLKPALRELSNSVGDGRDIDNIFVVGGGAEFFLPLIKDQFPDHPVTIVKDPVFANVRGFQYIGQEIVQHLIDRVA